ncbi:hypothetical protein VOLCADRAFT_105672 [Volvox carteri f. nagariensis]|uniref:DUF4378 domain-containing protein n=1 Tax=Volvox carteri f. nagariensis TaxID=3068 RepID=D8U2A9_VOLCA|nr:uncharacterized protein VOLCADRAFT_105672 [Volvox carteri f. nagariensis]EFJ46101.1 hypothetical protein VOLCADRAFT_105672 [Volvox carteri f. nagariensis]|eukprot:XP_002952851.1 hypothetical protein VOLCADRAFT_105672 [Volvox carteri f. nagariensis]
MPSQALPVRHSEGDDPERPRLRRTVEHYLGFPGPGASASAGSGPSRRATASSGWALSSEDSDEASPPQRRPQPINAELVKLVASFAPLELAQLKAAEQKARIRKAHAPAAAAAVEIVDAAGDRILPNPVAQKQTEVIQRQAAVSAYVKRLQREQDRLRAEKERRLKAEQDALAAQLDEESKEIRTAAAEVTRVPEAQHASVRRKKAAPALSSVNAALKDLQASATGPDVPEKKPADPRPWRHNMRKQKNTSVSGEAPIGAPREVAARAATGPPPPRNVSPGAAAARAKTLDPVARAQLKEFMERKAKETAAKQQQERAAQLEAKTAQLRVLKAEMAKARDRAQKYAETAKENPPDVKGPRPPWVDIVPPEGGPAAVALARTAPSRRPLAGAPDVELVSERAMPYHMSDAMRMEATERRRQERRADLSSPDRTRSGHPVLVDNFGHSIGDDDLGSGPQVVRVQDPESEQPARVYRSSSARPGRPLMNTAQALAQIAARQQVGYPIAPETLRALEVEARIAARKKYEQHQREVQARVKQQMRRARSEPRTGSANRRVPAPQPPPNAAPPRDPEQRMPDDYPTAVQAELQQARNERHVGNLWDLALQLSVRLEALQRQGMLGLPQQPIQAWPDPSAQLEQQQQPGGSLRDSMAGPLLPYPPPVAVVPTGLPMELGPEFQVQQYDEAVEADIEFNTEASWPVAAHKKPRTTGGSSAGVGADGSEGGRTGGGWASTFGDSSVGDQSRGEQGGSVFASDEDTTAMHEVDSTLTSGLHPASGATAVGTTRSFLANMSSMPSQSSFSTHSRDQDGSSLHGTSGPASPAQLSKNAIENHRRGKRSVSSAPIPSSPSKQAVPAAPIIQIPLPTATSYLAAEGVEPAVSGLPYDNATFSAESADDDGSSSSGESMYGQRVLTIAELHGVLDENPRLAQRLSLDRERDRWEDALSGSPSRTSGIMLRRSTGNADGLRYWQQAAPSSPSIGRTSDDSDRGTPPRPCDAIVNEYEKANSLLRPRPAQLALLKAQAAKRAEERLEGSDSKEGQSETDEEPENPSSLPFPKADDPLSVIKLIAHKGRLPVRPTIIQLTETPVPGAHGHSPIRTEQETQTAPRSGDGEGPAQEPSPHRGREGLLTSGSKRPQVVLSRELTQSPPPQLQQQPRIMLSSRKTCEETSPGPGRIGHGDPNGSSAQQLTDSLPPFVIVTTSVTAAATSVAAVPPPVAQQGPHLPADSSTMHHHTSGSAAPSSAHSPAASMQQQVDAMRKLHLQQLEERGLSESSVAAIAHQQSSAGVVQARAAAAAEGPDDGASGLLGAMGSPQPRPRMVTFLDEAQGPPERVRLAPGELFNQMQTTLKTYEELDAAELELQQLQNARAIAAVQREAHRIAQRLDQTAAAEAQLHLIAQTQAEMDAKLHAFEENIRNEVRKDSLGHLHDVTALFVEQLSRNKVVHTHSMVQTTPPPPSPPRPNFGVQQPASQQPAALHDRPSNLGGSPGPSGKPSSSVSFQRPSSNLSNPTTEYSPDFEESELRQSSYISGRSASRVTFREASQASVPESISEEEEEEDNKRSDSSSEIEEEMSSRHEPSLRTGTATSMRGSVLDLRGDRQTSHATEPETSFASVAESILSERPPSRSALRQQASTLSVPESVDEEPSSLHGHQPARSALRQQSTVSVPESVGYERSTTPHGDSGGGTESVPYSSITGGETTQPYSSIQESLPSHSPGRLHRPSSTASGTSRRPRSAIEEIPSEPGYSTTFEKDEDEHISEELKAGSSRTGMRTDDRGYSTEEVQSEPSGHRSSQRRRISASASVQSTEVEEVMPSGTSPGYSQDVEEDRGLAASGSSLSMQRGPGRPQALVSSPAPTARDAQRPGDVAGVMATPPSVRTLPRRDDSLVPGASPLSLRASLDGGLELDDDVMTSYAADAERRMRQEVALLQDRLKDMNRRADAKMDQLEAELSTERQPQKRQALIRAQRLLQVQHDADAADIQRQISAIKADYSRQRLMLERLYRLAQLTGSGTGLAGKRGAATPAGDSRHADRGRGSAKTLQPRAADRDRHASSSYSVEDVAVQRQQPSASGSLAEEVRVHRARSTTSSIAEEPSQHVRRASSSSSVAEDIPGGSGATEVAEEYSAQFEPSSLKRSSRSQLHRSSRPSQQPSSIVDDIEENLSGRRLGTSGSKSQSVVTEDTFRRSGSTSGSPPAKTRQPVGGSAAIESPYSEDFAGYGANASARPLQSHSAERPGASMARSDDLDSELSVLSLKLERERVELARKLREEKERRRAKVLAKQAEVERLRSKLAALKGQPAPRAAAPKREPSAYTEEESESVVEDEVGESSQPDVVDSGSKVPSIASEVPSREDAASTEESEVADEVEDGYDDDFIKDEEQPTQSSMPSRNGTAASASAEHTTSTVPSVDPEVAAMQREVAVLEEEVRRAKKARIEAMQRHKVKLEAQLKSLRAEAPSSQASKAPLSTTSESRGKAAEAAPPPQSHSTPGTSYSYSEDFAGSGSITEAIAPSLPGAKSSSSVIDEISQSTLQRTSGQPASSSRWSKSVSEERISSAAHTTQGPASRASSGIEDEVKGAALHISRSSGALGGSSQRSGVAGQASTYDDVYDESFETESAVGGSIVHEASEIQDEAGHSEVPSGSDPTAGSLEPIREEDVRSISGQSISYAADSIADRSVQESVVFRSTDTAFGGFPAPGDDSIAESGHGAEDDAPASGSRSAEDVVDVIGQFSYTAGSSGSSQSVQDEQSGSQRRGQDIQDSQPTLSEFLTTADIDTPSVTPSIHSSELEAAKTTKTSSVPTTAPTQSISRSVASREATSAVEEFLASTDTIGESEAPSALSADLEVAQEGSLQQTSAGGSSVQDVEESGPLIVTRHSSGSGPIEEEEEDHEGTSAAPMGSRSTDVLHGSVPESAVKASGSQAELVDEQDEQEEEEEEESDDEISELEVDYSGEATGVEEPEEAFSESALHSQGRSGLRQPSSLGGATVEDDEYEPDFAEHDMTAQDSVLDAVDMVPTGSRVTESTAVEDDVALQHQRSAASASAEAVDYGGFAQPSSATVSADVVDDGPVQRSGPTVSTTPSALPEEYQADDYDDDFQPSVLEVPEESSRNVAGTLQVASASTSRALIPSQVEEPEEEEEDDYESDFQSSALGVPVVVEESSRRVLQPPAPSASASRLVSTGDVVQEEEDIDEYELDFDESALDVRAEVSSRTVHEPSAASVSEGRLASKSEMVQDASELLAQASLPGVTSTSSIGSRRLPGTRSHASSKAVPSVLHQQASSVSAATYDEDFEEGEPSELQLHGTTGLDRTALSVVQESVEDKAQLGATASNLYSDDIGPASNLNQPDAVSSVARSAAESSATEVAGEDLEYDYGASEADEDEQQFSGGSTGLVGPVLPPAATTSVALEVSKRYGPASKQSSGSYSEDFQDQAYDDSMLASALEESAGADVATVDPTTSFSLARDADKDMQPLMAEPRSESSIQKLASLSVERRTLAPPAAASSKEPAPLQLPVAEPSTSHKLPPPPEASTSVLSVVDEGPTSATVSSESSTQELPQGLGEMGEAKKPTAQPQIENDGDDDYTRDFSEPQSNVEALSSITTGDKAHEDRLAVTSHPIGQLPSPSAQSDDGARSLHGDDADDAEENEPEAPEEEDLDLSDLGLDTPVAGVVSGAQPLAGALTPPASSDTPPRVQGTESAEASTSMASEMEVEDSGILAVPRGRGIRQTRQIESRTWRSQQSPLDEEDGLDVDVDLVDLSGPDGSGLLDALGADLITEASEVITPSHSFRMRSGDLASAPSSGSPYGVRSAMSIRLATLRESLDHEGEESEATSEVVTPTAASVLRAAAENVFGSRLGQQAEAKSDAAPSEEGDEEGDEEEVAVAGLIPAQASGSEATFPRTARAGPFEQRAQESPAPAPERTEAASTAVATEPSRELSSATGVFAAAAAGQVGREVSAAASTTQYSDDLEAPPSEVGSGRLSVEEYDPYTSAALAADDSDELLQVAAAFESQAIDADDTDGVAAEYSAISASGMSDDLSKYKVAMQPDSDDEAGGSKTVAAAPAAVTTAANPDPAPAPAQQAEAEDVSSEEAPEVEDEEPEAAASDPFSVDESSDRLPTLRGPQLPVSLLATTAQAAEQAAAAPLRAAEAKGEAVTKSTPAGPVPMAAAAAASSPTATSPRSERSSQGALPGETSLGPLPRSGLGDDDDDDGQGLEYRAMYKPHGEPADTKPAGGQPPSGEAAPPPASEAGVGTKGGYFEELRKFAGSDDDDDGFSGGMGARGTSAASLKPMFQALLDQPESEADLPKGEFESEIEEMLRDAASRSRSRLVSPFQSRDWALDSDAQDQDVDTPGSAQLAAVLPSQPAAAAAATTESVPPEVQDTAAPTAAAGPSREHVVEEITESTVKELVADAVEVMVGITGKAAAASTAQLEPGLRALSTQAEDRGGPTGGSAAAQAAEDSSRSSMGGEASISMSVDDLEGDLELDADAELGSGGGLDLPSPIPSDSGSLGSPMRPFDSAGAAKSSAASAATPSLGPERSDRDLALSGAATDEALADSGVGLNSDEDLGWGGADLEEDWQPDVSGYIAPEMDQAAIERENAPAVSTGAAAVAEYASQVLEQFINNRPEFLVPGAEPLSLEGFLAQERRLVHASEAQHIHNKMVYDAINEALLSIYRGANRVQTAPWLRRNRVAKPLPSPAEMAEQVQQQLRAWSGMRMRDPAEMDKVLAMDAQEDERARADLVAEEAEVVGDVANLIFEDLLTDTALQLTDIEQLLTSRTSSRSTMPGAGRRRLDTLAP